MKHYLIFVIALFSSCSTEPDFIKSEDTVQLDLGKSAEGKFSDKFESIDYLLLDFSDTIPLVSPYNLDFRNSLIYIRDMTMNNLFVFNENGKVEHIIRSTGKGPGEFFQMDGFQVTEDRIYIQDAYLHKNLEYSLDGSFIRETKNNFNNTDFYVGDGYTLYFMSYQTDFESFNFIRKDNSSEKNEGFLPITKELQNLRRSANRNGIKENIEQNLLYFNLPNSTKVVTIHKNTGKLDKIYKFDFGKYNLEDKRRSEPRGILNEHINKGKLIERIYLFHPLFDQYFLNVKQGEDRSHFIFLNDDFSINYQAYNLVNNIDGMPYDYPWTARNNQLIFRLHSSEFYNQYIETFSGVKVKIEKGNIHDFFQKNKKDLKEDKWVLVKLNIR